MAGYWMGVLLHEIAYERKLKGHEMTMTSEFLRSQDGFNLDADREPVSGNVNKTGIDATLDERGSRYGLFTGHAAITQGLKSAMYAAPKWAALQPDQKEALEMVQHKIGRILNGDPDYHDSWHDIVGYAKLVADRLAGVQR